jgi:hypothetical protein
LISRAQPPPTCPHQKHYIWGCINHRFINIHRTKQQLKATKLLKIISLKSLFSSNREVEKKDVTRVLEIHIFITQFFHKFDLRTTMLVRTCLTKKKTRHEKLIVVGLPSVLRNGYIYVDSVLNFHVSSKEIDL